MPGKAGEAADPAEEGPPGAHVLAALRPPLDDLAFKLLRDSPGFCQGAPKCPCTAPSHLRGRSQPSLDCVLIPFLLSMRSALSQANHLSPTFRAPMATGRPRGLSSSHYQVSGHCPLLLPDIHLPKRHKC